MQQLVHARDRKVGHLEVQADNGVQKLLVQAVVCGEQAKDNATLETF